ncbi:MAG: hypothetical protein ABSE17_01510 [Candidatus Levyibacteriota bacterium]|jgi:hypothetical protein
MTEKDIKPPEESMLIGYPPPVNARQKKLEEKYEKELMSAINHLTKRGRLGKTIHDLLIESIRTDRKRGKS